MRGSPNFNFDDDWQDQPGDEACWAEFLAKNRCSDILNKLAINIMQAALKQGEFSDVISYADAAFNFVGILGNDLMKAHHRRGVAYFELGEYRLAVMDLWFALQLAPNNLTAKAMLHAAEERAGVKATKTVSVAIVPVDCPMG